MESASAFWLSPYLASFSGTAGLGMTMMDGNGDDEHGQEWDAVFVRREVQATER